MVIIALHSCVSFIVTEGVIFTYIEPGSPPIFPLYVIQPVALYMCPTNCVFQDGSVSINTLTVYSFWGPVYTLYGLKTIDHLPLFPPTFPNVG